MPRRAAALLILGFLILWIGLIFGTSCTVVRPQEFFAWFHQNVFRDEAAFRRFEVFWGLSWFAVVKGWHVTEFAILTLLAAAVLFRLTGQTTPRVIGAAMLFCFAFAISDEWHQTFVPDRHGTVTDVVIDALGIALAGLVLLRWSRARNRRVEKVIPLHPT